MSEIHDDWSPITIYEPIPVCISFLFYLRGLEGIV